MTQHPRYLDLDVSDPDQILRYAAILLRSGEIVGARELLERCLNVNPLDPRILNFLGNIHVQNNELARARQAYENAYRIAPHAIDTLLNIANLHHLEGDLGKATRFAERTLENDPTSIEAQFRLSLLSHQQGDAAGALLLLDKILMISPDFAAGLFQRAILHMEQRNPMGALSDLNRCIELEPSQSECYIYRGDIFLEHGHSEAAALDYETALSYGVNIDTLHYNYGKALALLNRPDDARHAFQKALMCNPASPEALFALGTLDLEARDYDSAVQKFSEALEKNHKHIDALNNRALAFKGLNDYNSALSDYQKVLETAPRDTRALQNAAVTCLEIKDYIEATRFADKAIESAPSSVDAHLIKGHVFFDMGKYDEALETFHHAKKLCPTNPEPDLQIGNIYRHKRDYDNAIVSYSSAIDKGSKDRYLRGDLIFTKLQTCAWDGIDTELDVLIDDILNGRSSISPFIFLTFCDRADQQRLVAEDYVNRLFPKKMDIDEIECNKDHKKIRIGYYSADFNDHATMHLMANLFEEHDRSKFELYAFSFGPQKEDKMRARAEAAFDHFIDASELSDKAAALVSRYLEIDVAVDLKGYTTHSRPNIFAYRAAPVQINYLGFPGTMGADFMDYIIADQNIIPDGNEKYYSEKVLRVSGCYQVNDQHRPDLVKLFKRADLNLPEDKFVFCSFNNNYKILPRTLDAWSKILKAVPNSVFWILADNKTAEKNLKMEFSKRGITADRLIFAGRMPSDLHLARQACADLFLDTYPCAAHTTASDAVYSGLPLLTIAGETFASRVASSILYAVGLPDLVTKTFDDYVKKAIELGNNPERCLELSKYLSQTVRLSPLFNTRKTARELEELYMKALAETVKL